MYALKVNSENELLKQQEEALGKVNTIKQSLKETLDMQKENVGMFQAQLTNCKKFSNEVISTKYNRRQHILTYKNLIINIVKDLTKQVEHASIDPECTADDVIVRCGDPVELRSNSFCNVSGIPYLPHCRVMGPLQDSNHEVKLIVTLKDIYDYLVVQQSRDLQVRCNKEGEFLKNVRIEENSSGVYYICINLNRYLDHLLSVRWRGQVVNLEDIRYHAICMQQ